MRFLCSGCENHTIIIRDLVSDYPDNRSDQKRDDMGGLNEQKWFDVDEREREIKRKCLIYLIFEISPVKPAKLHCKQKLQPMFDKQMNTFMLFKDTLHTYKYNQSEQL